MTLRDKFAKNAEEFDNMVAQMFNENDELKLALAKIAWHPDQETITLTLASIRNIARNAVLGDKT